MNMHISKADDGASRAWTLRLHLQTGQRINTVRVDGIDVEVLPVEEDLKEDRVRTEGVRAVHIAPVESSVSHAFFPFGGEGGFNLCCVRLCCCVCVVCL